MLPRTRATLAKVVVGDFVGALVSSEPALLNYYRLEFERLHAERGQVSAATEDGTGQSAVVLTTQVARPYEQEGDRTPAVPLGLHVRRWAAWVRAGSLRADDSTTIKAAVPAVADDGRARVRRGTARIGGTNEPVRRHGTDGTRAAAMFQCAAAAGLRSETRPAAGAATGASTSDAAVGAGRGGGGGRTRRGARRGGRERRTEEGRLGHGYGPGAELIHAGDGGQRRLRALDLVTEELTRWGARRSAARRSWRHAALDRFGTEHLRGHADAAAGFRREPVERGRVRGLCLRVLDLVALEVVRDGLRRSWRDPRQAECSESNCERPLHGLPLLGVRRECRTGAGSASREKVGGARERA